MSFSSSKYAKYLILLIGCLLIPLAVTVPMLMMGVTKVNVSGILNDARFGGIYRLTGLFMLVWSVYLMNMISENRKNIILFALTAAAALFLPYDETNQAVSLIHIFSAYAGFIAAASVLYPVLLSHRKLLQICILILLFCILHSFTSLQVTGLSEIVFADAFNIVLALLAAETL